MPKDEADVFYLLLFVVALFCFAAMIHRSMHPSPVDECIDVCEQECRSKCQQYVA
jgi:hypothetical protein